MYRLYWMYIRVCSEKEKSKILKKSEFKKKYNFFSKIHPKDQIQLQHLFSPVSPVFEKTGAEAVFSLLDEFSKKNYIFFKFRFFSLHSFLRKSLQTTNENFRIFRETLC